jgi:hypothetical protein
MLASSLWHHLDLVRPEYTDLKPILSEHTQRHTHVRTYALPNSEVRVAAKPCGDGTHVHLRLSSGQFNRSWMFVNEPEHIVASYFAGAEKYMLVIETVTTLPGVRIALAQDVSGNGRQATVDLILQPVNQFTHRKFRLLVDIAADPCLLATVTFFETFWLTPTDSPVVRKRNAKHFASAAALAQFVHGRWR